MEFTLKSYAELIDCIRQNGYILSNYSEHHLYEKAAIIKHDVDMSLEKAAEFAEFEADLGIRTVYNILLCSDFYNPYSKKNMDYIERIQAAGHEIGLHFDEVRYTDHILENIDFEINLLEKLIGGGRREIHSVSMHRPSPQILESNLMIRDGEIINTYSQEFFKQFKYISDSRRNWREDPIELINSRKYNKIHILTHPIWYTEKEEDISMRLKRFLEKAVPERYEALNDNIRDLKDVLKLEEE